MILALACAAAFQTVNGVKPIPDPTPKFAQATAKMFTDSPTLMEKPDWFQAGFYSMKVKVMLPLMQTKYTAAQFGICGTMLGLHDPQLGLNIRMAADRISKGDKDFDSFATEEKDAISKSFTNEGSPIYPFSRDKMKESQGTYFPGANLGALCGYVTLWHISPTNKTLQGLIGDAVKGCAETGKKDAVQIPAEVLKNLNAFSKWQDKSYDEATMTEIGKQIEVTLKSSLPEKYRW